MIYVFIKIYRNINSDVNNMPALQIIVYFTYIIIVIVACRVMYVYHFYIDHKIFRNLQLKIVKKNQKQKR